MNILLIYTHPNPESFNKALLETVLAALKEVPGAVVRLKDLYKENFNPILSAADLEQIHSHKKIPADIAAEQEQVLWADRLIFIYPLWWYDRPALLKGWIDRVFLHGFAFAYGPEGAYGLLKHEKALVIQTAGSSHESYAKIGADTAIERAMTEGTLEFAGVRDVTFKTYFGVGSASEAARKAMLEECQALVKKWVK